MGTTRATKRKAAEATVSSAYAQTNFGELLKQVKDGAVITVQRYNTPVAVLSPPPRTERRRPQFGMVKGIKVHEPNWAAPMTDDEVDAALQDPY